MTTGEGAGSDVIVIGAGHNGLVAACYLAKAGHDVLVVEAADQAGGCTTTSTTLILGAPEHRISPCAVDFCLIRASGVVADLDLARFGYREVEVDPQYLSLDPEGASIAFWRNPRRTADEIAKFSRADASAFLDLARGVDAATAVLKPLMLAHPTRPAPRHLASAAAAAARHPRAVALLGNLTRASAAEVIDERFTHPMVRGPLAVLAGGGGPITVEGTGFFLVFWGFLSRFGLSRLVGGSQGLPDALQRCLEAHRGRVRTGSPVARLIMDGPRVTGVCLASGEELRARAVVASCDPRTTLTDLLPADALPPRLQARARHIPTKTMGAGFLKVDLALSGRLEFSRAERWRGDGVDLRVPALLAGSFEDLCRAYQEAGTGILSATAPFAGLITTGVDPSLAPAGQDVVYLWTNAAPTHPREPWEVIRERAGQDLVDFAARWYEGIEKHEIGRFVEAMPQLRDRIRATDGNALHVDITPFRSGPLRPALGFGGYRTPVPGLFLTGAGTHPGPTVSGIPGRLAAVVVDRSLRQPTR